MRLFILLLIITLFSCDNEEDINDVRTTSGLYKEISKTWNRFNDWRGEDDIIVFPIITDLHSGGNDKYKHISYVLQSDSLFQYDFIANLGDLGIDEDRANTLLNETLRRHQEAEIPTVFCKGNHEDIISDSEFSDCLQRPFLNENNYKINIYPNSAFGYLEIEKKKTRIFFLNTSDSSISYSYGQTQLQYIIDNLSTIPGDDWCVVFLAHWCPHPIGRWNNLNGRRLDNDVFIDILESFVMRKSGNSNLYNNTNLSWDFSNSKGSLVGYICGDSHFDCQVKDNGVNYIISQGYGVIANSEKPESAIITSFDYNRELLIDIVAIKPLRREMKFFRMGAGGYMRDRIFSF